MTYIVKDPKGVGYADKSGQTIFVEKGKALPFNLVEDRLFTQECLDKLVEKGRLSIEGSQEAKSTVKTDSKEDLIAAVKERGLSEGRNLAAMNKKQLKDLLSGAPSSINKKDPEVDKK